MDLPGRCRRRFGGDTRLQSRPEMTETQVTEDQKVALMARVDARLTYYIELGLSLGMDVDKYFVNHEIKIAEAKAQLKQLDTLVNCSCFFVALVFVAKIAFAAFQRPIELSENYIFGCYFTIAFAVVGRYFDLAEFMPWVKFKKKGRVNAKTDTVDVDITLAPGLYNAVSRGERIKTLDPADSQKHDIHTS